MILNSLALLVAAQGTPDPSALVSKMFAYYNDAKSMSGTITFNQAFQNNRVRIDTKFQFEWPAKIYISQVYTGTKRKDRWLVTGDGEAFTYDEPRLVVSKTANNRLYEPVQYIPPPPRYKGDIQQPKPPPHDVRSIYRAVCLTIGDRSLPLDVAFGRKEDLQYVKNQLKTVTYKGEQDLNGEKVHVVRGLWRDHTGNEVSPDNGEYELYITDSGELRRFARSEHVDFRNDFNVVIAQGQVITIWDVNIKKNAGVDPALFKVVLKY